MSLDNIILTGFMGSGKSTVGRALAKDIGSYFVDTDKLIESFENKPIAEIFNTQGEEAFREMERYCFKWIKEHVNSTVISVGGGFPVYVPEIKEAGIVIYLKVEFDEIIKRLSPKELKSRPLFQDFNKAKELYEKRDKIYSFLADYTINNVSIDETVKKIKELVWK
ncbi:MAG: shikimate kinase [Epsilonproteobacteria bacterium]|nr:shikimate kinase [Campylobacterota bacterium]